MMKKLLILFVPIVALTACKRTNEPEHSFNLLIAGYYNADSSKVSSLAPTSNSKHSWLFEGEPLKYIDAFSRDSLQIVEGPRVAGDTILALFKGRRKLFQNEELSYYRFKAIVDTDTSSGKTIFKQVEIVNLTSQCYYGWEVFPNPDIELRGLKWRTTWNQKIFASGEAEFRNTSSRYFEELDFRLRIYLNGDLIFSKTKSYDQDVPPGDIFNVEIEELQDFYAGDVISRENMDVQIDILEIRPALKSKACIELESIEKQHGSIYGEAI